MPPLAELQRLFARGLLGDPSLLPGDLFAVGPITAEAALRVHRNTVIGALAKSLALTFPTVATLIGEACFDQVAATYAAANPPTEARLAAYGGTFPAFLETAPQTCGLAWLPDVARLDLAIRCAAAEPLAAQSIEIEPGISLSLPASLIVLDLLHPADRIREAVESGEEAALAAVELTPSQHALAVWRAEAGVLARPLSPSAGRFLAALVDGSPPEDALAEAVTAVGEDRALAAIQSEVFAAPFAAILQPPKETLEP